MAQYPTAAGTDANLFIAKNNLSCSLNGAHNSAVTTITVNDTTGFPTAGYITIDAEAISYTGTTGTTFTGCTRGADSTTAASHVDLSQVKHTVIAAHHNVLKDEIKAVEGDLVGLQAALNQAATPASTATTVLDRLNQVVSQIKLMTGGANWYTAPVKTMLQLLPLSGGTMSGNIAMGSNKLTGLTAGSTAGDSVRYEQLGIQCLQRVYFTTTSTTSTSSASYVATALTTSFTPISASSKIRFSVSGMIGLPASGSSGTTTLTIARGGTNLAATNGLQAFRHVDATNAMRLPVGFTFQENSPGTSAVTYDVRFSNDSGVSVTFNELSGTAVLMIEEYL